MKNNSENENIIDVQKIYSEEIIQEIQNALNSDITTIKTLTCVDELPKTFFINHVKLVLSCTNGHYDTCMYFDDSCVDNAFMKKWKTEPIYAFLHKDWKRLNKNINIFENNNYIEANLNIKNIDITALLRRVDIELADNSFAMMEYGDIYYNNAHYAIVKAFSSTINESYNTSSELENDCPFEYVFDCNGNKFNVNEDNKQLQNTDIDLMSIDEIPDPESEELF